jgi:hypothetical protein
MTYWNNTGTYQITADALNALIPPMGEVPNKSKNKALETFRIASNLYYEIFKNGCMNYARGAKLFGLSSSDLKVLARNHQWNTIHMHTEPALDRIIKEAAAEQGLALL